GIGDRRVLEASELLVIGVLGPDAWIVQARRDRVRLGDLPIVVLEHVAHAAVEDADGPGAERGAVLAGPDAVPAGLHAHDPDAGVPDERPEEADGVGAAPDARHEQVREPPGGLLRLGAG